MICKYWNKQLSFWSIALWECYDNAPFSGPRPDVHALVVLTLCFAMLSGDSLKVLVPNPGGLKSIVLLCCTVHFERILRPMGTALSLQLYTLSFWARRLGIIEVCAQKFLTHQASDGPLLRVLTKSSPESAPMEVIDSLLMVRGMRTPLRGVVAASSAIFFFNLANIFRVQMSPLSC